MLSTEYSEDKTYYHYNSRCKYIICSFSFYFILFFFIHGPKNTFKKVKNKRKCPAGPKLAYLFGPKHIIVKGRNEKYFVTESVEKTLYTVRQNKKIYKKKKEVKIVVTYIIQNKKRGFFFFKSIGGKKEKEKIIFQNKIGWNIIP